MKEGEYVYCVIAKKDLPEKIEVKGLEGKEVYAVTYKDLTAVASKAPIKDYKPTDENAEMHKQVALYFLKHGSVLPVAFGMVFKDQGVLRSTMRQVYAVLKRSLRMVAGKMELGVKAIFPKEETAVKELCNGQSMQEFRESCQAEISEVLSKLAVTQKKDRLFSEKLVCNQSFLVEKEQLDAFTEKVEELRKKYDKLKMQYTGPWPAYNFVNIHIMSRGR